MLECIAIVAMAFVHSAQANPSGGGDENNDAQRLLHKMQYAAHKVNFSGILVYQQGSQVRTSRITHLHDGKNEFEKLEVLDGTPREYLRKNDEIVCYLPDVHTLLIEKKIAHDVFPAIFAANPTELTQFYEIKRGHTQRIAGHETQEVVLEPKDNLRYGYRLAAEKTTGLLLRAQTINENNDVVEQITFTQLEIGNINRARVRPTFQNVSGWHIENSAMGQAPATGWSVKNTPPGFKKIREMKRMIVDLGATSSSTTNSPAGSHEVVQMVYSDGVAAISVFIEPGARSKIEGFSQQGALNIAGKRQGDFWLTIVGEVPATAIRQVANSIEFKTR
jgi:sigma-E factor negative regulatory protein RseB